jgi:hypothetical protein
MNKHLIKKIFIAFLIGVLISIWNVNPVFSQSIQACATNPACAAELGLVRTGMSAAVPTIPFSNTVGAVGLTTAATVLALNYLKPSDLSPSSDRQSYCVYSSFYANYKIYPNISYHDAQANSSDNNPFPPTLNQYGVPQCNPPSAPYNPPSPYSDSNILASAATAAAAAAADSLANKDYSNALKAASAATAAAGLVSLSSGATQPEKDKASAAASAAAAVSAAVASAPDAPLDTTDPLNVKVNVKNPASSTNFVAYSISIFATKFPFDFFYAPPIQDFSLNDCPSYTFFYYKFQFCFLVPLFNALRWIITIGVAIKMIYLL